MSESLNDIAVELTSLLDQLERIKGLTLYERKVFVQRVANVLTDLESDYGIPALSPDRGAQAGPSRSCSPRNSALSRR